MAPKRKCSCKGHEVYSNGKDFTVYKNDGKKMKRSNILLLESNTDLFNHSKYICNACCEYAEKNLHAPQPEIDLSTYFDKFIEAIKKQTLSQNQMQQLAYALGNSVSRDVQIDSASCTHQYKDDSYLMNFKPNDWVSERNGVVVKFMEGVTSHNPNSDKDVLTLAKAIEQVYFASNSGFVGPLSFAQSLMTHYLTGSKGAINMQGAGSAGGSYTSVTNWARKHSQNSLTCPKETDVVTFFDNNQVIQRKWRVESNFKSSASVITTVIHIIPDPTSQLQKRLDLSPVQWLHVDLDSIGAFVSKFPHHVDAQTVHFKKYRDHFTSAKLKQVFAELRPDGSDHIDPDPAAEHIPQHNKERYTFIPSGHAEGKTDVTMGDPCFANPCSYESVQKVLDHIKDLCGVAEHRQWTFVGCDGLPYTLGSRIIGNIYKCPDCPREFEDEADFTDHRDAFNHAADIGLNQCRKYNNIVMLPGLGHYEINMVKAIFKLLWDVCIADLAKMLGFRSPKALAACESASDHHKSWQILQILLHAMSEELVLPYCQQCHRQKEAPTLAGYHTWCASVCSPNVILMREAIFTYLLALHVFRAGVRRNNSAAITASKIKFAPLFFGLNMPFYMETFMRDSMVRMQCPPEVSAFIENHESYSVSGNNTKGEGGDFVLENKNRQTKGMIPPGVPTDTTWLNVCRNVDRLAKIKKNTRRVLCLEEEADEDYTYNVNISREIRDFRRIIRTNAFLEGTEPVSLSGVLLDSDLVKFSVMSKNNMSDFLQHIAVNGLTLRKKYTPIFTTSEARVKHQDMCSQTKSAILEEVDSNIEKLEEDLAAIYRQKLKKIKWQPKNTILAFLKEIKDLL